MKMKHFFFVEEVNNTVINLALKSKTWAQHAQIAMLVYDKNRNFPKQISRGVQIIVWSTMTSLDWILSIDWRPTLELQNPQWKYCTSTSNWWSTRLPIHEQSNCAPRCWICFWRLWLWSSIPWSWCSATLPQRSGAKAEAFVYPQIAWRLKPLKFIPKLLVRHFPRCQTV